MKVKIMLPKTERVILLSFYRCDTFLINQVAKASHVNTRHISVRHGDRDPSSGHRRTVFVASRYNERCCLPVAKIMLRASQRSKLDIAII